MRSRSDVMNAYKNKLFVFLKKWPKLKKDWLFRFSDLVTLRFSGLLCSKRECKLRAVQLTASNVCELIPTTAENS